MKFKQVLMAAAALFFGALNSSASAQELTALLERASFNTPEFEEVRESFIGEALSLQLSDESNTSALNQHASKFEQAIVAIQGKNRLQVLCHLYSFDNCDRLRAEDLYSARMLIPRAGQSYSREDILKYVLMDKILLGTIANIVNSQDFYNSDQVLNFVRFRLNNLVNRGGVTSNVLGIGLALYRDALNAMSSRNIFYGLEPFISSVAIKSLQPFNDSKDILARYIEFIANSMSDLGDEQINANNVSLFKTFLVSERDEYLDQNLDALFFIPESKLKVSDGYLYFFSFLDQLIYKNLKEGLTNQSLLSLIIKMPFDKSLNDSNLAMLNSDFSFAARGFEGGRRLDEYRKSLFKFLKTKRTTYQQSGSDENFKRDLVEAINFYYGSNYTENQVFEFQTQEAERLFQNEQPDENNLLKLELNQAEVGPGVYGYKGSDLAITFSKPLVVAHPLSLVTSIGRKIAINAQVVVGLNLDSTNRQSNEEVVTAEEYNRTQLRPSLPFQKDSNIAINSSDQGQDFQKACSQFNDGDQYDGRQAYLQSFKRFEIGNLDMLDEVKKPSLDLNGSEGRSAGDVDIDSKLSFVTIFGKGQDGSNGQSNDLLYFKNGPTSSLVKVFSVGYEAECEIYECRFFPDDITSSGCRPDGTRTDTKINSIEVKIGTMSPGRGGNGGNGGNVTLSHQPEESFIVLSGGKGGKDGANIAGEQKLTLGILEEPSYFPALSLISTEALSGTPGKVVIND